jgi:hypothetical protein
VTRSEAAKLVRLLKAAHSTKPVPADTVKLYESRLAVPELHYEIALEAVRGLIDSSPYWPKVAEIKTAYRETSARRRSLEPAPPLPEVSPQEREWTLAAMREYMARIGRPAA